jgi:hypothetical protein
MTAPSGPTHEEDETMAKYAILIYEDEAAYATGGAELFGTVMEAHRAFSEKAGAAIVGGEALQPTPTATSLRTDGAGEVTVTDGAFAETTEALGGFYLIAAADLDAAIAIAKTCPAALGGVEVRPVMVFD